MDNDEDMVDRAAKYIFYIIYNETSLSGLIMAFVGGWVFFFTVLPKVTQMRSTIGHRIDCHR